MNGNGVLYMVASPIGNLGDISMRALEILRQVDVIACEDTRVSRRLLTHYQIAKRLLSCRAANERASAQGLIKLLAQGMDVAYLSDAGTPGISDPGALLVQAVRESGYSVVPLPGASALTCLLSVAGIRGEVMFAGFLPHHGNKRAKKLSELMNLGCALVLYESPQRLEKLLLAILAQDSSRKLFLTKEMTKKFEQYFCGNAQELLEKIDKAVIIKGEFSLLLYPVKP